SAACVRRRKPFTAVHPAAASARSRQFHGGTATDHNGRKNPQKLPLTTIAICNILIADRDMSLGEKLRYLREVEGALRGLGREMTQQEIVRAIAKELKKSISQSYLSQIESGARPHLTNATRLLLARFFKVHPGYLVDDPAGYHTELISDAAGLG